jgi:hypothetical protein
MKNPFGPKAASPLEDCMNPALAVAKEEAARAASSLARHRAEEERARLLAQADAIASRRRATR